MQSISRGEVAAGAEAVAAVAEAGARCPRLTIIPFLILSIARGEVAAVAAVAAVAEAGARCIQSISREARA
jgi:hypothetical protein